MSNKKSLLTGALVAGTLLSLHAKSASELFDFQTLGSGAEVRSMLLEQTCGDKKDDKKKDGSCGAKKDDKKKDDKGKDHKCGEGKCGADKKKS